MIGSNMAQTALMIRLTPHLCLYDPYAPALEGVAEELRHCAFQKRGRYNLHERCERELLRELRYICIFRRRAARKAGMTREDLLKGNAEIAAQFGKDIRSYCPDVKHGGRRFQSGRYYGVDRIALFGFETVSGIHACGAR